MLRFLPVVIELGLLVFCLIDCIQTDSVVVRNLNKTLWILLIIFVPIVGAVAWLVAGRPQGGQRGRTVPWPSTATAGFPEYERPHPARGPDDDEAFLADLKKPDHEHEAMLAQWEHQLRDREAQLGTGRAAPVPDVVTPSDAAPMQDGAPSELPSAGGAGTGSPSEAGPDPRP
ncbi:MAG: hypothetical protein JWP95_815 [Actinotalea sp.]|nr:hypothetical protein [Actinotalea sp.]